MDNKEDVASGNDATVTARPKQITRTLTVEDMESLVNTDGDTGNEEMDSNVKKHLETQLPLYNGPNPFVRRSHSKYETFKFVFFAITGLLFVKLILAFLIIIWCYLMAVGITVCNTELENYSNNSTKPNIILERKGDSCIRKPFTYGLRFGARMGLFLLGFYWIPVNNANKKNKNYNPRIITPNHCALVDPFVMYAIFGAVPCAKKELRNTPLFGRIFKAQGVIWIDRYSREGRRRAVQQVSQTAENKNLPPVLLFPQGTVSNTLTLTQFKPGAFISGLPVQPVAMKYANYFADLSLLDMGNGKSFIHTMCQFINFLKIDILEEYFPNEKEKNDASLYANNVRNLIGKKLNATMTSHTFDDVLFKKMARKYNLHKELGVVVMDDVNRQLSMRTKTVIKLGKIYLQYANGKSNNNDNNEKNNNPDGNDNSNANNDASASGGGVSGNATINFETFCQIFKIKDVEFGKMMFDLLRSSDKTGDDKDKDTASSNNKRDYATFDDFLVGVAICYQDAFISDARLLFFECCNRERGDSICAKNVQDTIEAIKRGFANEQKDNGDVVYIPDEEVNGFCERVFGKQGAILLGQPSLDGKTNAAGAGGGGASTNQLLDLEKGNIEVQKVNGNNDNNNDADSGYINKDNVYLKRKEFFERVQNENDFIQAFLQFLILTHLDIDINEEEDGFAVKFKSASQLKHEKEIKGQEA